MDIPIVADDNQTTVSNLLWTKENFEAFVRSKPLAVIQFDATWDVAHRPAAQRQMRLAQLKFETAVAFAEVDIDVEPELFQLIGALNIPAIGYYRNGILVAALIGADQDVAGRIDRLKCNQKIGYGDGFDTSGS